MKKVSQTIKVEMLDYAPKFKESGPDKIIATSGILTAKMKNFKEMLGKVDDKVLRGFHNEATRRGHASLTTSTNFYFWLEGSRIIDFYFSSFPFCSCIMFSSRKIEITTENLIVPDAIANSKFKDEYEKICKNLLDLYKEVKEETKSFDQARKLLPIGFSSQGFFNFPLQVVLGIIKEVKEDNQSKNPHLPKEIGEVANILEKHVNSNVNYSVDSSLRLPYNTNFPHPNLFKSDTGFSPHKVKTLLKDENFVKSLKEIENELMAKIDDPNERIKKFSAIWKRFVEKIQDKILLEAEIVGSLSSWNDIKRHRTVRQKVESIYHAAERCLRETDENNFFMPKVENQEMKKKIINSYNEALLLYEKMIKNGIEKRDAIYVIPHGINLGIRMFLDGYHLFDPFGFVGVRSCTTTDHEIVTIVNHIINELKKEIPEIENLIGPKCKIGYCPEKVFCGVIKKFVKNYDENMHMTFQ